MPQTYSDAQKLCFLAAFILFFLGVDLAFARLITYPIESIPVSPLFGALAEFITKYFLCVAIPAFYITHINHTDPIRYGKLDRHIAKGFLTGLLLSFGYVLGILLTHIVHGIPITFSIGLDNLINGVFAAGLFEEILFRSFLYQELRELFGKIAAAILTSGFFVVVHIPYGQVNGYTTILSFTILFLFSLLLCALFERTESIWGCALLHAINNLTAYIL